MKKGILFLVMLIIHHAIMAQTNFNKEWIIGFEGYIIKFDTTIIHDTIKYNNHVGYFASGQANICDSSGTIVLTTDGMDIMNHSGDLIENGDSLASTNYYNFYSGTSGYSQSALFLPMANRKYYLVTPTCNDTMLSNQWLASKNTGFNILNYSIIDMHLNAGAGKVIKRMQPILENVRMDKTQMMACRHANGKDWWLLKKAGTVPGDSNYVFTLLFTQDSVFNYGIQNIPFPRDKNFPSDLYGQMQFNQSGTQMATIVNNALDELYIADFDRCAGSLNNYKKVKVPVISGDSNNMGLCFSPNGNFLYVIKNNHILQFDLLDTNQSTAWYTVYGIDTTASEFQGYTSAQLAPNGKIYIGHLNGFSKQMSVIDNPNMKGGLCNFCRKCLRSKSYWGYFVTPPNMPNYDLGAMSPCWPLSTSEIENTSSDELMITPNPAQDQFTIEFVSKVNHQVDYNLYDALGRLVQRKKIYTNRKVKLDISHLPNGHYIVEVQGVRKKVVVE